MLHGLFGSSLLVSAAPLVGQATSAGAASSSGKEAVVQLSAFEVTSDKDRGYSSSHAIGATRTDTPLHVHPPQLLTLRDGTLVPVY